IKAAIVEQDEKDEGIRGVLNFGHTVGHALEAVTGYGVLRHGEAVAVGMVAAARISCQVGLCSEEVPSRLQALLQRIGLPTALQIQPRTLKEAIGYDKKIKDSMSYFVLTKDLGSVTVAPVFDPLEALEGL
ncbi:MAG: 3-dehydroquinate synthase family protein, partial [Candidatus Methylomirabilales bacterium]